MRKHRILPVSVILVASILLSPFLAHCSVSQNLPFSSESTVIPGEIPAPTLEAASSNIEIKFMVQLPESENDGQVYLDVLDEVTGLAINPQRYSMTKIDEQNYQTSILFVEGSLVKYRYSRDDGKHAIEHTPAGEQVHYRMYYAKTPGEVSDVVSTWSDSQFTGETGRITGTISDSLGTPLPDILVTAGGLSSISASDGSFLLQGVATGLHNLAAISINGDYLPFQQGAVVAATATTQASILLRKADRVNITFVLTQPEGYLENIPVRMIGNLYAIGNTFSNLDGGGSISVTRAPTLNSLEDNRYTITLSLPTGFDLRYKYSMGDGFWNSELNDNGAFFVRQLIVPDSDTIINDHIEKWSVEDFQPVTFDVTIPKNTPSSDTISIQFKSNTWAEPIPMSQNGVNHWKYILYSPFHLVSKISYRYCRNDQCETALAEDITGSQDQFELDSSALPVNIHDEITKWTWLNTDSEPITIVGTEVIARGEDFIAGIELLNDYDPTFQTQYSKAFQNIQAIGANWTIITPTWHFTSINPPVLEQVPGEDPLGIDIKDMIEQASRNNLKVILFPQSIPGNDETQWWKDAERDSNWWQIWFDQYRTFLLHFADIAQKNKVNAIILGEPGMYPGLTNGKIPNGMDSRVFEDAESRWTEIINEIRTLYSGEIILAVEDPAKLYFSKDFISQFDKIYILVDTPLSTSNDDNQDLSTTIDNYLDDEIHPFWEITQKPFILGIKYPSHPDAEMGCVQIKDQCLSFDVLDQPNSLSLEIETDLDIQYKIYEAFLNAVNDRQWINGFVSRGYYLPVELQDFSSSVRDKPAAALLWYWFPKFISPVQ